MKKHLGRAMPLLLAALLIFSWMAAAEDRPEAEEMTGVEELEEQLIFELGGEVVVSGDAFQGGELEADVSGITLSPPVEDEELELEDLEFSYQWLRGDNPIGGATSSTYSPVEADVGEVIRVRVSAQQRNVFGSVTSEPTGAVVDEDGVLPVEAGPLEVNRSGAYRLPEGYSGTITIANEAESVKIIGASPGSEHEETNIVVAAGRTGPLELTIEDLYLIAPGGSPGIDFGDDPDYDYDQWPNVKASPGDAAITHTLYLSGSNSVTGAAEQAGVRIGDGLELVIDKAGGLNDEQAELSAQSARRAPAIGGGMIISTGAVTINGGTITATGREDVTGDLSLGMSPGIGSLYGAITINGGVVTSTGGGMSSGIGVNFDFTQAEHLFPEGAQFPESIELLPGSNITINGGKVTAEGGEGMFPGLGSFILIDDIYTGCTVTINGGDVTATGGSMWES